MTAIQWTDRTWNPVVGCRKVSEGCRHCYAEKMANRLAGMARADEAAGRNAGRKSHYLPVINERGKWNGTVQLVPEALADPLRWRKPSMVFVGSMSDPFHEDVPFDFIDRVFAIMALCPQHTFQVLTKRPERMAEYLAVPWDERSLETGLDAIVLQRKYGDPPWQPDAKLWPLPNVWLGTSVEDQATADLRIPHLIQCPAAVRFLSCEPLLGPVDLLIDGECSGWACREFGCTGCPGEDAAWTSLLDWIIIGGESGHSARPCDVMWITELVRQCREASVPAFVKQLGSRPMLGDLSDPHGWAVEPGPVDWETGRITVRDAKGGDMSEWPEDLRVREFPEATTTP